MLKKITLAIGLLLFVLNAQASHIEGGELRYEFNGTNYTIYATRYFPCGWTNFGAAPTVNCYSATCNDSVVLVLTLNSIDTVKDMWCLDTANCGTGYNPILVLHYSDTVSLPPCSDWMLSTTHNALSNAIDNMGNNVGSYSLYLEAFLDNSMAVNRNALVMNHPPFYLATFTNNTLPFQAIDADGDSVVRELEELKIAPGISVPFGLGFSNSNQMGAYTAFNNTNETIQIDATTQSEGLMVTKIKEYRNGVLVGYHNRVWMTRVRALMNNHVPMAVPGSNFYYTTCPGQSNSITINFEDSVLTDSVYVDFYPPALTGFTFTPATNNNIGTASGTISWTTPTNLNVGSLPYFVIPVRARDNNCPDQGYSYYGIMVKVLQCNPDSVWAGDANADYIVNMYDPLAIAVAYGTSGTVRTGATINWQAEYCANWGTQFNFGVNHKHADCNGDGSIDNTDLAAVTANYGQIHLKEGAQEKSAGVPDLYFDLSGLTFAPGTTVNVPLMLGDAGNQMYNMYGVAVNIDLQGVAFVTAPTFNTTSSWIATSANQLNFTYSNSNENIDFVEARKDQLNISGFGAIAIMSIDIPAGVADGTPLIFDLGQARIIDNNGDDITAFNTIDDTAYITTTVTPSAEAYTLNAMIVPNPSSQGACIRLSSKSDDKATIIVTDITGRIVYSKEETVGKGTQKIALPQVIPGIYEVRMQSKSGVRSMKWTQL